MAAVTKLLLVEDNPLDAAAAKRALRGTAIDITHVTSLAEAVSALADSSWDLVLCDYKLPDGHGIELLAQPGARPLILVTGGGNEELAVAALKAGVSDYIVKDVAGAYLKLLPATIDGALSTARMQRELAHTHEALTSQLERLRTINTELKAFASRVSHDVRAPLRRIRTFVDLIVREVPHTSKDVASMIDILLQQVDELDATTKRLLEFSKAGGNVEGQTFDARALIERATQRLSVDIEEAGARLEFAENMPRMYGDPTLLELVVQNLTSNAIKFRGCDPLVVCFTCHEQGGSNVLLVTDNGRGVDSAEADRLFEPFFRGSRAGDVQGTGIGLSTCRRIIEAHGGKIRFVPVDGTGACVEVVLPRPPL